ncbi:hypothetical protein [Streptomyces sp. ME18-1-4]|uniref:hypothetical protein n=1 Tax=Streptomyces sp. ME18-1-4 TaxID=3028685 RepID=UPI0029BC854F|nr:hypothetical protein [Streptomyces sp. ME18-1-4]MDX3246153.1 hypothetical protein [Streptomyces sp. ME18-1-4]
MSEPVESSEDVLLDEELELLVPVLLAVVLACACIVPTRAKTPAAAAGVTAAAA